MRNQAGQAWERGMGLSSFEQRPADQINGDLAVVGGRVAKARQIGGALVVAGRIQAAQTDDQIAQRGQVSRRMAGPNGGSVLAEGHVPDAVKAFDAPMSAAELLDLSGIHAVGGATGEEDFSFLGHAHLLEMVGGAADDRRLHRVGETGLFGRDGEGIDFAGFMASVSLIEGEVRREKKRRWWPGRVWPAGQRAWVDWL